MSVHGSLSREMTLLAFKWRRTMDEYTGELNRDWQLDITIAWWILTIERWHSYKGWRRLRHVSFGWGVQLFGYHFDLCRSMEDCQRRYNGDYTERHLKK